MDNKQKKQRFKIHNEMHYQCAISTQFGFLIAEITAVTYVAIDRLVVAITIAPLGTANVARDLQNSAGSAAYSTTLRKLVDLKTTFDANLEQIEGVTGI